MSADACWDAFGSDSDSQDEQVSSTEDEMEVVADAVSLSATHYFAQLIKSSGVSIKERLVAVSCSSMPSNFGTLMSTKFSDRGLSTIDVSQIIKSDKVAFYDGAVIMHNACDSSIASNIRKRLLPGGRLWIVSSNDYQPADELSDDIWDVESAITAFPLSSYRITQVQKRACLINSWSCPWMDKHSVIPEDISSEAGLSTEINETYLQYEKRLMNDLTICTSVAERNGSTNVTVLTNAHIEKAVCILRHHGFVIIKGLLPPEQTLQWGEAVLADFQEAVDRLKSNPNRPVNLLNPHQADNVEDSKPAFEPLSYKEMSMREDLRVDLRDGPSLKMMAQSLPASAPEYQSNKTFMLPKEHNIPHTIDSTMTGILSHWRFHPSLIAILKALFNPKDEKLSKGNFGRWNFGGSGPDGTAQPFRIGPIGSVISCPGSGDQAIHADTQHLFEHIDCLPCHYCNVFTPGFATTNNDRGYFKHEFDDDGVWTGNTTIGGTALVNGSHKLSVTAKLLAEDEDIGSEESLKRKQLLQLETIRPALEVGDVLICDNRTLHYGLANTSAGDKSGMDVNAGRRPMMYLNVTQSWFHDPKNWDDRESIFD